MTWMLLLLLAAGAVRGPWVHTPLQPFAQVPWEACSDAKSYPEYTCYGQMLGQSGQASGFNGFGCLNSSSSNTPTCDLLLVLRSNRSLWLDPEPDIERALLPISSSSLQAVQAACKLFRLMKSVGLESGTKSKSLLSILEQPADVDRRPDVRLQSCPPFLSTGTTPPLLSVKMLKSKICCFAPK